VHLGLNLCWLEERSLRRAGPAWRIVRQVVRLKLVCITGPARSHSVRRHTAYAAKAKRLRRFGTPVPIGPLNLAQDFAEHLSEQLCVPREVRPAHLQSGPCRFGVDWVYSWIHLPTFLPGCAAEHVCQIRVNLGQGVAQRVKPAPAKPLFECQGTHGTVRVTQSPFRMAKNILRVALRPVHNLGPPFYWQR